MRSEINLEYSHFYLNEGIGHEQLTSMHLTEEILANYQDSITLSVLVDDRPLQSGIWKTNQLRNALKVSHRQPDWIVRESGLNICARSLVSRVLPSYLRIRQNIHGETTCDLEVAGERIRLWKQIEETCHFSCACLAAAWLLCRLGEIELPHDAVISTSSKPFIAEQALSVLHQRYQLVEGRAHEIIRAAGFSAALKRISYQYYQ